MIEDGFLTYLSAQSTVTAFVGIKPVRMYSMVAPEKVKFPFIVFSRNSTTPYQKTAGDTGKVQASMDIDVYATEGEKVFQMVDAVRLKLDGYSGSMGSDYVNFCLFRGWSPLYIPPQDGQEFGVYTGSMTFDVMYEQTVPSFS